MFNLDSDHCPDFCLTLHKSRMVVDHQGMHQVAYILCDINRDGSLFNSNTINDSLLLTSVYKASEIREPQGIL